MKNLYVLFALISIYFNGLSINSSTGVISGKPTAAAVFKTTISGNNAGGTAAVLFKSSSSGWTAVTLGKDTQVDVVCGGVVPV